MVSKYQEEGKGERDNQNSTKEYSYSVMRGENKMERKFKISFSKEEIEDMKWALIAQSNRLTDENICELANKRAMDLWLKLLRETGVSY